MLIWPATRFVAGEDPAAAFEVVRRLNGEGITASLDLLGENVRDRERAVEFRNAYVDLLRGIATAGIDSNVSIKLTMIGLDIDRGMTRDHLVDVLATAREAGNFVRIDMEGSPYVQLTLEIFEEVFPSFDNVGVVIQSMLRRSERDVERLNALGARVRLVKGAYKEPAPLAYPDKDDVNDAYDRLADRLLDGGNYPAIATHDDARIAHVQAHATERAIAPERFEFQMLYGIRAETQRALVERGWRMRVYVPFGKQWLPYFSRRLRERKENVAFVLRNLVRR